MNTIARSKKLNVGYKQTTPQLHDFSVHLVKLTTTLYFPSSEYSLQERDYKHNEAVKAN